MDPTQNTSPTDTTQVAPATQPAVSAVASTPALSPDQVDARIADAVKKATDATWKQAREVFEKKANGSPKPSETQPALQPANTAPAATTALDIARVVQFTTEAAQHGIPAKGIELLATRLDAERPTDVRAWVAEQADAYGWRKPTPTTTTAAPSANAPVVATASNATPVTGSASPSNPTTVITDDVPLIQRSEQQRQDYIRQHGYVKYTDRFRDEALRSNARLRIR